MSHIIFGACIGSFIYSEKTSYRLIIQQPTINIFMYFHKGVYKPLSSSEMNPVFQKEEIPPRIKIPFRRQK